MFFCLCRLERLPNGLDLGCFPRGIAQGLAALGCGGARGGFRYRVNVALDLMDGEKKVVREGTSADPLEVVQRGLCWLQDFQVTKAAPLS